MEFPLSPAHPTFILRLVLAFIVFFVPMPISAFGLVSRKQWSLYLFRFVLPLGVVGLAVPVAGFVLRLMGHSESAPRLYDLGGMCVVLSICAFFGGTFADAVANGREPKIRLRIRIPTQLRIPSRISTRISARISTRVSTKRNRPTLLPLCPSHNQRMKVNAMINGYSCPSEGCSVSYTVEEGYIRVVNGVKQEPTRIKPCTTCTARTQTARRRRVGQA